MALTQKRLMNEIKQLSKDKLDFAQAIHDENDNFIFYFLLVGQSDSEYAGGYYIGKILLPKNYPESPGDFMMLTPNGRFTPNQKICLSNTGYHSNEWTPTWTIINNVKGIYSIFIEDKDTGISHIKMNPIIRKKFADESIQFNNKFYPHIFNRFNRFIDDNGMPLAEPIIENNKIKKPTKTVITKPEPVLVPVPTQEAKPEPVPIPVIVPVPTQEAKPEPEPVPIIPVPTQETKPELVPVPTQETKPEPVLVPVPTQETKPITKSGQAAIYREWLRCTNEKITKDFNNYLKNEQILSITNTCVENMNYNDYVVKSKKYSMKIFNLSSHN